MQRPSGRESSRAVKRLLCYYEIYSCGLPRQSRVLLRLLRLLLLLFLPTAVCAADQASWVVWEFQRLVCSVWVLGHMCLTRRRNLGFKRKHFGPKAATTTTTTTTTTSGQIALQSNARDTDTGGLRLRLRLARLLWLLFAFFFVFMWASSLEVA